MIEMTFISSSGDRRRVSASEGVSVMQVARDNDVSGIVADCGGALSCATCHVHVAPDWSEKTGTPSQAETEMLEMAVDPDESSRLCCQITLSAELDGLEVIVPKSQF